MMVRADKL